MERILLLERLKELYLKQKGHTESEQWDAWEAAALDIIDIHEALSEINENSHAEKQLISDIVKLYSEIKTELENKLKQTGDELSKVDKDLAKLRDNRMKLLEQQSSLSDTLSNSGGTVFNARC